MNSIYGYIVFTMAVLACVLMVNGCTEDEPTLSRTNKILSDSIIRVESKLIAIEVDSLCGLVYEVNFDRAVDSVSAIRLQEIEKYIPVK